MASDARQIQRLQAAPPLVGLPPEPSLSDAYTDLQKSGLTKVFEAYDNKRKEWATRLKQTLDRLSRPQVTGGTKDPRVGWVRYVVDYTNYGAVLTQLGYGGRELEITYTNTDTQAYVGVSVPEGLEHTVPRFVLLPAEGTTDSYHLVVRRVAQSTGYRHRYIAWLKSDEETDPAELILISDIYIELI